MLLPLLAVILGLVLLVWSADRFVDGAATTARYFGIPAILIGMVIIGFGTSAPEMLVSVMSAMQGNPGLALGNAYGSNIVNIGFILGLTALLKPITVHSQVLRKELPILLAVTFIAAYQLLDAEVSRLDAWILLAVFLGLVSWSIWQGLSQRRDALGEELEQELAGRPMDLKRSLLWLVLGLILLILSSRLLVWGAIGLAQRFGVSDLVIGLTIVAIGTSLPELASSLIAVRKGEHDLALGNIVGSNLFNTLAVVGLAGTIMPMDVGPEVLTRDVFVMGGLTIALLIFCLAFRGTSSINRVEGGILVAVYLAYLGYLVRLALTQ